MNVQVYQALSGQLQPLLLQQQQQQPLQLQLLQQQQRRRLPQQQQPLLLKKFAINPKLALVEMVMLNYVGK